MSPVKSFASCVFGAEGVHSLLQLLEECGHCLHWSRHKP